MLNGRWSAFAAALLVFSGCGEARDDGHWRGRIDVISGVTRVMSEAPILHPADSTAELSLNEDLVLDGRGEQGFSSVFGITTDRDDNVFVADAVSKRILKFSPDGRYLASVGSEGVGPLQFRNPVDMVVDAEGKLYVIDSELNRVSVFNPDLSYSDIWPTRIVKPRRIRIDAEGNVLLFVITQYDLIYKFKPNGDPINSFYDPKEAPRRMGSLDDLVNYSDAAMEMTNEGYVVVSARHPYWIRKFDRVNGLQSEFNRKTTFDITPLKAWEPEYGPPPVGISGGLAVFPDGRILNVVQYQELEQVGMGPSGLPQVTVTRHDRWYDFFTPEGKWEMTAQPDVDGYPMHVDRHGRIYFAELEKNRIVRYAVVFPGELN